MVFKVITESFEHQNNLYHLKQIENIFEIKLFRA